MEIRKISFNQPIIALNGTNLNDGEKDLTLGSIFAPVIAQQTKGDALKLLSWAMAIYNNDELSLDKSDILVLTAIINDNQHMTILVKAQLLEIIG